MILGVIPFVAGIIGLVGFWCFRVWEARRFEHGTPRLWDDTRKDLDVAVATAYQAVATGDALRAGRTRLFALVHAASHRALLALVALLRAIERPLARHSYRMRMMPPKPPTREPSEFLKTITPEKKSETGP